MGSNDKTKKQLSDELKDLQKRFTKLQRAEAKYKELEQRFTEKITQLESAIRQLQGEISEHRKVEKSLFYSERFYRNIVVQSKDAVFAVNQNGEIAYANPTCESIFGYTPEEFITDSSIVSKILHPDYKKQFDKFWNEYSSRNILPQEKSEWAWTHKDGHTVYTENSFSNIFDDTGNIIGFHTIARDITERKLSQVRLYLQYNIVRILSESINIDEALKKILQLICENNRWIIGEVWFIDEGNNALYLNTLWNKPVLDISDFEAVSRKITFQKGKGLPGRVWESGQPAWITDVLSDTNFLRESAALKIGLHGAFAFPIMISNEVIGVLSFFSRDIEPLDDDMLKQFDAIGRQIGNFIEKKRAEENLSRTNQELQALINASPMAIISLDRDKRITLWSKAAERIFGWTKGEVIGKPVPFIPEDKRAEFQSYVSRVFNGEVLSDIEIVRERRDGSIVFACLSAAPLLDAEGNVSSLMAVIEDITEKKIIEENIIKERNLFQSLIESLPGIFYLCDNSENIIRWNKNLEIITGYSADEIARMKPPDFIAEPDRETVKRGAEEIFIKGSSSIEANFLRKDGKQIPFYFTGLRIMMDDTPCIIGVGIDISERKEAEDALRKMEEELLKAKKLESIGVLAGGIAHDFNNLLTAILGNVSLAKMFLNPKDKAYGRLSDAEGACQSARELSYRLITFSKGGEPFRQESSLSELVENTVHPMLSGTNVQCECNIPDNLYLVKIDAQQMKQVISHLIKNALEAMADKGLVRVYAKNVAISKKDNLPLVEGDYVMLSVEDNGRGIPEENMAKIFDPYFSTKEMGSQKGQGLGLSICYSIVKKHEGFIAVDSKIGEGTAFHVYIPACKGKSV
jgi:PAS domain S-box-containing protein